MAYHISQAMVLAAGLGTRLRPLTDTVPKPLLPLGNTTLLEHQLAYLRRSGITSVVINLHHLGEQIRQRIGDGSRQDLSVTYSDEPELLGTGGGIKQAMGGTPEPFVVLNADALTDVDLSQVIARHEQSGVAATMVVKALDRNGHTPVAVSDEGFVVGFGEGHHFYTGLQIVGPALLATLPPVGKPACLIGDGYRKLLENGERIAAFVHDGYTLDLGTPERYAEAQHDIAEGRL